MAHLIRTTSSHHVFVDASSVDLVDESTVAEFCPEWDDNGLVEAAPPDGDATGIKILCGQEIGNITVTVQLWDGPPPLEADGWQDVVEIQVHWASAFIDFSTATEREDPAQRLDLDGPGDYRVRVSGKNRDDGDPRDDQASVEGYLIQVWPAPSNAAGHQAANESVTYKRTSDLAAAYTTAR
ncbi:hypothetical protein [Streptomyces swartbergensis]|uniref:hypothetical protein n=1 Tax=Streptomyces swartbergensis TaxID=487165 RepID=UPI0037F6BBC5